MTKTDPAVNPYLDPGAETFQRFEGSLQFRDWVMGGTPMSSADIIKRWLQTKMELENDQERLARTLRQTITELNPDVEINDDMSVKEMEEAFDAVAAKTHTNGFKRNGHGIYIEGRQLKAMLKESTNILFAGTKWGPTKKGPKNYVADHVFVMDYELPLGQDEPSGTHLSVGHVTGPQGPRSTLTHYEYAEKPTINFEINVTVPDSVKGTDKLNPTPAQWSKLWLHAQENGLGALRSQGYGRFDVLDFQPVS